MVKIIKPYIEFKEVEGQFKEIFESGIFTRGKNVDAFRQDIVTYTGAKHAVLATSATTALWSCLKLLGVVAGDEVIVSDFSFPATANVVEDLGAIPVFADVDLETFNMLPAELEKKISPRTKAVIFVDALGNPTGLTEIKAICEKHGVPLIEDAACAIGSSENGQRCGSIADLTCFSFHPRKLICTGEGGAITTNRDDWAQWLDIKLSHGASGMKGMALDFVDYGYNFRLSELPAVLGSVQLKKLDSIVDDRNALRSAYIKELSPYGFEPQRVGRGVRYNVQSLVFKVPESVDRDDMIQYLKGREIEATIGTYCLSGTTYFSKKYSDIQPNASFLEARTITLPCHAQVDPAYVCRVLVEGL